MAFSSLSPPFSPKIRFKYWYLKSHPEVIKIKLLLLLLFFKKQTEASGNTPKRTKGKKTQETEVRGEKS